MNQVKKKKVNFSCEYNYKFKTSQYNTCSGLFQE